MESGGTRVQGPFNDKEVQYQCELQETEPQERKKGRREGEQISEHFYHGRNCTVQVGIIAYATYLKISFIYFIYYFPLVFLLFFSEVLLHSVAWTPQQFLYPSISVCNNIKCKLCIFTQIPSTSIQRIYKWTNYGKFTIRTSSH